MVKRLDEVVKAPGFPGEIGDTTKSVKEGCSICEFLVDGECIRWYVAYEDILTAVCEIWDVFVRGLIHNLNGTRGHFDIAYAQLLEGEDDEHWKEVLGKGVREMGKFVRELEERARRRGSPGAQMINLNRLVHTELVSMKHHLVFKHRVKVSEKYISSMPPLRGNYASVGDVIFYMLCSIGEGVAVKESEFGMVDLLVSTGFDEKDGWRVGFQVVPGVEVWKSSRAVALVAFAMHLAEKLGVFVRAEEMKGNVYYSLFFPVDVFHFDLLDIRGDEIVG